MKMVTGKMVTGKIEFTQDDDSCVKTKNEYQKLIVHIDDAGGGPFLAIQTTRWSINSKEELKLLLSKLDDIWEYKNENI